MNVTSNKNKFFIAIFVFTLMIISFTFVKAYYNSTSSMSILASLVGDFDTGDGDINMMFYKETNGKYVRTFAAPALGYTFDDTLTTCSIECSNSNPNAACYYHYDSSNNSFSIDSNNKVTCKFYFKEDVKADIIVNILKEDENGTYEYNSKKYSLSEHVPAYGYEFVTNGYSCDNNSTLTYDSNNRVFNVHTTQKETCYAYFDKNGKTADVTTSIYVQNANGTYEKVDYIPQNKTYQLSQSQSSCTDSNATITYENGYISISAVEKQTCSIYLDLIN